MLAAGLMFLAAACLGQPHREQSSGRADPVERFLRDYLRDPRTDSDKTTRYCIAFVDLKDDGINEIIVYISGRSWCGSGGCMTFVLAPQGSSYKVVAHLTITRLPIRVLKTKSNGWHDITVQMQGGGIVNAYEAKLSFNGRTYPSNRLRVWPLAWRERL